MTELFKAVALCSASLGGWTLLSLLLSRRGEPALRRTLAALVALLLLPPLNLYVTLVRGEPWAPLNIWIHSLTWAYGPLLLRCVGLALLWPPGRWRSAWLSLPVVLIGAAGAAGFDWAREPVMVALVTLHTLGYAAYAAHHAWLERARLRQLAGGHRNSRAHWMLFVAAGLVAFSLWDLGVFTLAMAGYFLPSGGLVAGVGLGAALYVDGIALLALHPPARLDATEPAALPAAEPVDAPKPAPRALELSPEVARELAARLERLAQTDTPHRDPDISLPRLAALMDITPHQLSELLNLHLGSSFYDYLNDCRHDDALQLLQRGSDLTVADIAYRAGFNNRNSFYKVFKEKTGMTPTDYRRQQQPRRA
ncbi:MAG: AraC family transcriptional regulator [Rubrivivax sp.]|nr:MAG: AraC family transcriptional regulator [Rubrivivax sp.]